ncbi:Calreticulin [Pteropus alecto]|uniref:Calreticulin n=1 Tax=Pteropus alecto TaxID=9402 RepID=L5KCU7_PTEAL|nr:Calreticulin [Pteropus alecto]
MPTFYALSARFKHFSNKDQTLVVQLTVKHEQNIDHGGGYIKLFPDVLDQTDMKGDTEYSIMSGPDIYGPSTKKSHVIFKHKGKNKIKVPDVSKPKDWDKQANIDDTTDSKPKDGNKSKHNPDADAKKPKD